MLFATLVLLSAFLIEGIGTYVSVVGLSSLFAANPVIIILAIALDVGKVVSVSFLYKHWRKINTLMKLYMTIAAMVLMVITSAGAFGYLSAQFQKAISNTNESSVVITAMTDEEEKLQKRKEEIDAQVAQLPSNNVRGRSTLMKNFAPEVERINARIIEIDAALPKLKIETLKQNVEVGPIIYIAEAFNTTPEKAVKWVIFTIIFVFDPLAIALLLSGNFLIERRNITDDEALSIVAEDPDTPIVVPASEAIISDTVKSPDTTLVETTSVPAPSVSYTFAPMFTSSTTTTSYTPTVEEEEEVVLPEMPETTEEPAADVQEITEDEALAKLDELEQLAQGPSLEEIPEHDISHIEAVILGQTEEPLPEINVIEEDAAVKELEALEQTIKETLESHDEREIIRLNSIINSQPKPLYRSQLEDIGGASDIETDESRRASRMLRSTYNHNVDAIQVGGPSDKV